MSRSIVIRSAAALVLAAAGISQGALAALDIGQPAPRFTADAALGGKVFRFSLAEALARGPVVLYFFPAADSTDCSIEAHAFAEAMDSFAALGATVIGVSGDHIDVLKPFSVRACQSRFPVASDESKTIIKGFDALMQTRPDFANRISYVIAPNGKVAFFYQNLNPEKHVERMLGALMTLSRSTAQ